MTRKILKKQSLKFYFPKNILLAAVFVLVSLLLLREEKLRTNQRILGLQTQLKATQRKAFDWEQILIERPDYRDGWIQLAAVYYQLGDKEKAKNALVKAKTLDPLNETIISFEKLLQD